MPKKMPQIPGSGGWWGETSQKVPLMGINVATEADNDAQNEV